MTDLHITYNSDIQSDDYNIEEIDNDSTELDYNDMPKEEILIEKRRELNSRIQGTLRVKRHKK